ncbi:MAG: M20/M25/M40 family metallo-hydrolase [Chloracidobacterium sp.]|nr:M20/M25/M40 family metallo-hydrolase [Chloracidobacterium sp.]
MTHGRKWVISLIVTVLILCLAVSAQVSQVERIDQEMMKKIREEGIERSHVMETLSWLTDVDGPRLTNSPQYNRACEWAKGKLTEWGLKNATLEAWGPFGRGWSLEGFSANIVKPDFIPLIAYPKAWSPSTNGVVRGHVVYLDAKTPADLDKYKGKLKGAIVLLSPPRDLQAHFKPEGTRATDEELLALSNAPPPTLDGGGFRRGGPGGSPEIRAAMELNAKKWQMVYDEGAAVALDMGRGDGGTIFVQSATMPAPADAGFDRRPRPWAPDAKVIPQATLAAEHYNRIVRMLAKGVPVELEVQISAKFQDQDLMGHNVTAEIPGSDLKDEIVMVGGHFDSWHSGTGATDNGAGSAVAMEVVRILQSLGVKPRRTIRIGLWGGEEEGLIGSHAYVEKHFASRQASEATAGASGPTRPQGQQGQQGTLILKPEHEKFSAYFNLDNGTGKIRGVYLQGNEAVRPIFRAWLEPFRDLGASTLTSRNTGGTDHLSFDAVGLPGFQFIQDEVEYSSRTHHSNMDVYDRIQADDMKQAAVIIASFVYNAAMRDEKLPRKELPGAVKTAESVAPQQVPAPDGKQTAKTAKVAEKVKKQN